MFVCTQNVDNLHERAGSTRVRQMHGHLFRSRSSDGDCPTKPFEDKRLYEKKSDIAKCKKCGALIRPDICWFGEAPFHMQAVMDALQQCTVFLTVGSSGVVEPAASFVQRARQKGARAYYLGLEEPANAAVFDYVFLGKSGERLPELFQS
jgi:NAD-dependent deacetylase